MKRYMRIKALCKLYACEIRANVNTCKRKYGAANNFAAPYLRSSANPYRLGILKD